MEDVLLPERIETILSALRLLPYGWKDGSGEAIHPSTLETTTIFLKQCVVGGLDLPSVGPTEEGEVLAQWTKKCTDEPMTIVVTIHLLLLELDIACSHGMTNESHCLKDIGQLIQNLKSKTDGLENWFQNK